jgi:adenylate cyclase
VRAIYFLAGNWLGLGHRETALEWARLAESKAADEPAVQYNLACIYAQAEEPERALDQLEAAARAGFGRKEWIRNDPDLAPIREHPRFIQLFGEPS